jgi:hypothetical protein
MVADRSCLGLVDNTGKTRFGLRMSEVDFTAPPSFAAGAVAQVLAGATQANHAACNLEGTATFNWLLQFDTAAHTLTTGGAKPVQDPTQGYAFDDEMITQGAHVFHVQPTTFPGVAPNAAGNFAVASGQDLIMPIFLNAQATSVVLLPLHQARLGLGMLSCNQSCIGTYNAAALQPASSCLPDPNAAPPIRQFVTNAVLDGFITLEEADAVIISSIMQTLCVLLSGNASMYGVPGPGGVTVCRRDATMQIVYQGGWCAMTNMPAISGCANSEHVAASYAASSVLINN